MSEDILYQQDRFVTITPTLFDTVDGTVSITEAAGK